MEVSKWIVTGVWTEQSKRGTEQTVIGKICTCLRKKKGCV